MQSLVLGIQSRRLELSRNLGGCSINANDAIKTYNGVCSHEESVAFIRTYWSNRKIQIFDEDLTEFARKVALRFNLDFPQLGLTRTP